MILRDLDGGLLDLRNPNSPEPPKGSVITFTGGHRDFIGKTTQKRYDYAALRAKDGNWYTTGATCPRWGYSWKELRTFMNTTLVKTEGKIIA